MYIKFGNMGENPWELDWAGEPNHHVHETVHQGRDPSLAIYWSMMRFWLLIVMDCQYILFSSKITLKFKANNNIYEMCIGQKETVTVIITYITSSPRKTSQMYVQRS